MRVQAQPCQLAMGFESDGKYRLMKLSFFMMTNFHGSLLPILFWIAKSIFSVFSIYEKQAWYVWVVLDSRSHGIGEGPKKVTGVTENKISYFVILKPSLPIFAILSGTGKGLSPKQVSIQKRRHCTEKKTLFMSVLWNEYLPGIIKKSLSSVLCI